MNNNETYKLYKKHQVEIFDMIYDVYQRAPTRDPLKVLFDCETEEEKEEFNKKMDDYLKSEEPKIKEKLRELGFNKE